MKILVIEDEPKTVAYLLRGLTEQGYAVDVANNGIDGQHLALTGDYDAIVLDIMMPDRDGLSVLQALRREKDTPVIMLTARGEVDDRIHGLRSGADDYLVKPFSFLELLARLQALGRRGRPQEAAHIRIADLHIDLIARRAVRGARRLDLTAKEFALLAALARHRGQVLSKTVIVEMVWDVSFDSNTNVVEVAIKRLRAKLDEPSEAKLLHTIRGMGYVLEEKHE
ncbi:heavy metal response regulator transcription factor [Oxalicibacterium solurbis]|uniref:DNA-binding response regulator n=1 Tax=Oxalicibacterium solurbis TaxID=69280 RepID=A0A8J3B5H0_9BURK|nr:heavy metal response regulator transcription factor [Oxalicibacterium solurbis]GGI55184.1 DNA-binding response regulator [Oxalicibacterium solurbis]